MKLSLDYKKLLEISLLAILLFSFFAVPIFSSAQSTEELKNKISQKDTDIAKLEAEIAAYQLELDNLEKQKSSLAGSIKELDITRKKLNTDIAVTQKKIDKTNLKIEGLSSD